MNIDTFLNTARNVDRLTDELHKVEKFSEYTHFGAGARDGYDPRILIGDEELSSDIKTALARYARRLDSKRRKHLELVGVYYE